MTRMGRPADALGVLNKMRELGVVPRASTYRWAMCAAAAGAGAGGAGGGSLGGGASGVYAAPVRVHARGGGVCVCVCVCVCARMYGVMHLYRARRTRASKCAHVAACAPLTKVYIQ